MPLPNILNAFSIFMDSNIIEFLKRYQDVAEDYDLTKEDIIKRLSKYYEYTVTRPYIESIKKWENKDWDVFCKALKKEYEKKDHT